MSPIRSSLLLGAGAAAAGGLQVSRSLRFNASDSAYLSRVPGTATNQIKWTWAGWVKRSSLSDEYRRILSVGSPGSTINLFALQFRSATDGNTFQLARWDSSGGLTDSYTSAVFRDVSAWYHFVVVWDTANATAADRLIIYTNGTRQTLSGTTPSSNQTTSVNSTATHYIGKYAYADSGFFDGYLANIHFIDGQALTPSSFTETDATTGQLIPKTYSGSYGTNGFNLLFADNSSNTASTLGKDTSGNSNNWTPNNLSVTAGAGNDSLVDSPTNYGTDTGVGGEVRGNYCTLNPLDIGGGTLSNGNLEHTYNSTNIRVRSTISIPESGKWYAEFVASNTGGGDSLVGVSTGTNALTGSNWYLGNDADSWGCQIGSGTMYTYHAGGYASFGTAASGDVIAVAVDRAAGKIWWAVNNTWIASGNPANGTNARYTDIPTTGALFFAISNASNSSIVCNFGQRPFAYTAPSGFKALCTQNLPAPLVTKSNTVMDVVLYTGNNSTQSITSLAFNPDFVWSKCRNVGRSHRLSDAVRGSTKDLYSDVTYAESSDGSITAFTATGFNLDNSTGSQYNTSGETYVSWCWDAGTSTVSNPDGSITSQVRANATAGFSVVTYTAGATNATVGHGLGVAPGLIIAKSRTNAVDWVVYHSSLGKDGYLHLNLTNAFASNSNYWGITGPNSTTFGLATSGFSNNSGNMVAYCFSPVVGYSNFGSYTGNGSTDGPFVYTGLRPRFLIYKRTDAADTFGWIMIDSARDTYNVAFRYLGANVSTAEGTSTVVDFLSNGFKLRLAGADGNVSGGTYIYAAFAESPFNYSRAR